MVLQLSKSVSPTVFLCDFVHKTLDSVFKAITSAYKKLINMTKCNVIGCGSKQRKNQTNLSFHILPKNYHKRKLWIDAIGKENLKWNTRKVFICSLHFEQSCFNYTLSVTKLRDEAVPSRTLLPIVQTKSGILLEVDQNQSTPVICDADTPLVRTSSTNILPEIEQSQSAVCVTPDKVEDLHFEHSYDYPIPGTSKGSTLQLPAFVRPSLTNTLPEIDQNQTTLCVTPDKVENVYFEHSYASSKENTSHLPPFDENSSTNTFPEIDLSQNVTTPDKVQISSVEKAELLKLKCNKYKRKIKSLNEKIRRQKNKIAKFDNIIKDLRKKNLINEENIVVLQDCSGPKDFLKRQIAKKKGLPLQKQFSEELRKFAVTLHFLSPKAYEFVRREYNTCLPHQRTLIKWYQNINAEPGFCKEAFDALKIKVQTSNMPVVCALIFDEMSIRKSLSFDPKTKTYSGRIDIGSNCDSDNLDVASQCLVFMLTCVNGSWKLPLGYFFITSLTGEQKCVLIQMCVQKCEEMGAKVVGITCDGPASNFSMFSSLGCNLSTNQDETSFTCSKSTICAFIDPCHAIKLIRNAFGELKVFRDIYGRDINYNYVERLQELQETEGLHLATKLTKAHVMFLKQKMKVRLATQLLSNSVAEALDFCENKLNLKDFQGCAGTINFIKLLNDVFDVLNSRSMRPHGFKKAICPENIGFVEALFEGAISFIRNLKLPCGQLLIESRRKTGFIALIIDMNSALKLYRHLVQQDQILKYLPMYKVSQDHIELFFSAIRSRGGFNNNPTAVQFKAAFKRLLIRAEIKDSGLGNCIPLEQINILTCSSNVNPVNSINELSDRSSFVELPNEEDDSSLYEEFIECISNNNMSNYTESVVTYIAGFVSKKLSTSLNCETCISLLFGHSSDFNKSLITLKNRGGLKYPSKDVEEILKKTETIIKSVLISKKHPELYYLYIFKFFIDYFTDYSNLFNSYDNNHDLNHKYLLIKSVIQIYMNLRFKYFGKKSTEKITFRNYLNKIILFRNE